MCASMRAVVVLPLVPVIAAIGIRLGVPGGNSMSITGPATSRGRALARRHVHAEAGRRVDLADRAADLLVRLGDVGGEEVHAADVEPDRLDRPHRHLGVVGMHQVGHVRWRCRRSRDCRSSGETRARPPAGTVSRV